MSKVPANIAFNPLPWGVTSKGFDFESMPPISEVLGLIREAGFESVHAEIPMGNTEETYRDALTKSGLKPAPGYFQANFANKEELADIIKRAEEVARFHKRIGLDRIFIADQFGSEPERISNPAVGAKSDPLKLKQIADSLNAVSAAMKREGVTPCLHPHVGTMIETEEEINFILDATDENLMFGPDTGHIQWAGGDPAALISKHRERVGAVHIKDLHSAIAENRGDDDYIATMLNHIWTEPGKGNVNFDSVFKALGGFDGWFVIEVDYTDSGSPFNSAKLSAEWAALNAPKIGKK